MRTFRLVSVALAAAVACGQSPLDSAEMRLVLPDGGVSMKAGETRIVQVLVLGAGGAPVSISSPELPTFGTLEGDLLTLAPSSSDLGEHAVTLVAQAGVNVASRTFGVSVVRDNTEPRFDPMLMIGDGTAVRDTLYCPGFCTIDGTPYVYVNLEDPDGDDVTVDVEVVPNGEPFTQQPTFSLTAPVTIRQNPRCVTLPPRNCFAVPLPGLPPERTYAFAVRVTDVLGAVAVHGTFEDGWSAPRTFDQGPCVSRVCACRAESAFCGRDADCCSRSCSTYSWRCQ